VSYGEVLVDKSAIDLIPRVLDYTVTISFGYILYCVCFHLSCGCFNLFCNACVWVWVCVCVGVCVCACVGVGVCICGFCNVCVLVVCILALFGYPDGFFRAFSSVVRQMPR